MESQERGTPVLASAVGGIPELVKDKVNGRLFENRNVQMLASIIQEMWNDPVALKKYSSACSNLKRDDTSQYTEKLLEIYRGDCPKTRT